MMSVCPFQKVSKVSKMSEGKSRTRTAYWPIKP
jgi:hypothetical protein